MLNANQNNPLSLQVDERGLFIGHGKAGIFLGKDPRVTEASEDSSVSKPEDDKRDARGLMLTNEIASQYNQEALIKEYLAA